MTPSNESAREFLAMIFEPDGEILEDGSIAVWNKASKLTHLSPDPADAASHVADPGWANVSYFGVCTRSSSALRKRARETGKPLENLQGDRTELVAIPGVWVDIDVESSGHSKKSLAPTVASALGALARAVPLAPTITVETGGGIHAYWLFSEGVVPFTAPGSDRGRESLEMLVRSFQAMVRDELAKRGWSDDQTWALPRVMRIPGGMNHSHGEPRPVTWKETGPRHSIDDMWAVVPSDLALVDVGDDVTIAADDPRLNFVVRRLSPIEETELEAWIQDVCDIDEEFAAVWNRKRSNLTSQSSLDMSIATRLAAVDTGSQRIVDAIRRHRLARDPGDRKADRADYLLMTLQRAIRFADGDAAAKQAERSAEEVCALAADLARRDSAPKVDAILPGPGSNGQAQEPAKRPSKPHQPFAALVASESPEIASEALRLQTEARAAVNAMLGLEGPSAIVKIVRLTGQTTAAGTWEFHFGSGEMRAISGGEFMSCFALRRTVAEVSGEIPEPFSTKKGKPRQWSTMYRALIVAAHEPVSGRETTRAIEALGAVIERELSRSHGPLPAHGDDTWHGQVASGARLVVFAPQGSSPERHGVAVKISAWVDEMVMNDEFDLSQGTTRSLARRTAEGTPGFRWRQTVGYRRANGEWSTRGGYVLVTPAALAAAGLEFVATSIGACTPDRAANADLDHEAI